MDYSMICILGPTATGKTNLACHLASQLNAEIISADSRQVYRNMDIGTGKDLDDFLINGQPIPYHLIDICEAGEEYNVFHYQRDFLAVYDEILKRKVLPILCGGTGMYLEAVLNSYRMLEVPENKNLRKQFDDMSMPELVEKLSIYKKINNTTDTEERSRVYRALEIAVFQQENKEKIADFPAIKTKVFGIDFDRKFIRERITLRLKERFSNGMIEECKFLLDKGVSPVMLKNYGLEYRYMTQYLMSEITYDEMFQLLNTAIHQFAKRQMTWFRRMQKKGIDIQWIDGDLSLEEKLDVVMESIR